jgi:hypothetical protein
MMALPWIFARDPSSWADPQQIVHSFRTVMADTGAHRGHTISRAGFQSGAFEATANTNIDLVPAINERGEFEGEIIINDYRQLYDFIESSLPIALYHVQVLHGEVKPDRTPGEYDPLLPPEHLLP